MKESAEAKEERHGKARRATKGANKLLYGYIRHRGRRNGSKFKDVFKDVSETHEAAGEMATARAKHIIREVTYDDGATYQLGNGTDSIEGWNEVEET